MNFTELQYQIATFCMVAIIYFCIMTLINEGVINV